MTPETVPRLELRADLMTPEKPQKVICGDYLFEYKGSGWQIVGLATAENKSLYPEAV